MPNTTASPAVRQRSGAELPSRASFTSKPAAPASKPDRNGGLVAPQRSAQVIPVPCLDQAAIGMSTTISAVEYPRATPWGPRASPSAIPTMTSGVAAMLMLKARPTRPVDMTNPLSWLVISTGRVGRALSISMAATPLVIVGIALGLARGPQGVALGYSTALMVVLIPIAAWSKHGTGITWADLWGATKPPFLSGLLAGAAGLLVKLALDGSSAPLLCLTAGLAVVFGIYTWALLIVMRQKHIYMDVLSQLLPWLQQRHQVSHPILAKTVSLEV